jgi:hypothetical protein
MIERYVFLSPYAHLTLLGLNTRITPGEEYLHMITILVV